jgi:SAM-dependent methyltransferase
MSAWRAALIRLLCGLARPLQAGATACSYLAAGVLTRRDLDRALARLWDDLGQDDTGDQPGLLVWESAFYLPQLRPHERILLVGCGSGRDLVPLLERGHPAEGIDLAPRAIDACRQRLGRLGLSATLHVGSIESAALASRFDVVIFSWLCYGYIPGTQARIRALRNAREHLGPGGRVLLSYVRREPPPARLPSQLARLCAWLFDSRWTPEYGDLLLVRRGTAGLSVHHEHHFAPQEVEHEARKAGFAIAEHAVAGHGKLVLTVPAAVSSP